MPPPLTRPTFTRNPPPPVCTRRVPTTPDVPPSPMYYLVASRILEWTHFTPHPHRDKPDLVLPLSAAPTKSSFPDVEKKPPSQPHQRFPSVSVVREKMSTLFSRLMFSPGPCTHALGYTPPPALHGTRLVQSHHSADNRIMATDPPRSCTAG